MVLIEPTLDPASNALRVLLPPFEKKTTVSAAWSWHIPLRTEVELNRPSFELPLELDEAQRREWERYVAPSATACTVIEKLARHPQTTTLTTC
jgi:hypothetical protein